MIDRRDAVRTFLLATQPRTVDRGRIPIVERELARTVTEAVPGAVVEFGCYRGGMTAWMRSVLDALGDTDRPIHTYDSFRGLPPVGEHDNDYHNEGAFAAPITDVLELHDRFALQHPHLHPGWFADTLPAQLPAEIAFVYLDGDRYDSTITCLHACTSRLSPGAIVVFDDFADPHTSAAATAAAQPKAPGVFKACSDFFGTPLPVTVLTEDPAWALGVYRAPDERS